MLDEKKDLLKSFATLLDLIGGFGRDVQSSGMSWGVNDIAGRIYTARNSCEYVIYVSRSAWLFRLLRLAEEEIIFAEDTMKNSAARANQNRHKPQTGDRLSSYESARQVQQAVKKYGIDTQTTEAYKNLIAFSVLKSIDHKFRVVSEKRSENEKFREFVEEVAFLLVVPEESRVFEENYFGGVINEKLSGSPDVENNHKNRKVAQNIEESESSSDSNDGSKSDEGSSSAKEDEAKDADSAVSGQGEIGSNGPASGGPTSGDINPNGQDDQKTFDESNNKMPIAGENGRRDAFANNSDQGSDIKNRIGFTSDNAGVKDNRSPLPPPDLSGDQALIILTSSWHAVALVPVSSVESIQAAEYLLNDKTADKNGNTKVSGAECVAAFKCRELQAPASASPIAHLVNGLVSETLSDDSRTRKIFILAEAARTMIEIGVASRFFSHIVRPVGSRFDSVKESNDTQAGNRAKSAVERWGGALRMSQWLSVPLGILILLWLLVGSAVIIYEASTVSPGQSMTLPLGALAVVVVLTAILSALSYRLLVGTSLGSKRAFQGRLTRKALKDAVETESDRSAMLRRLRAQLSAQSIQFWTDLYQDHKVWSFAEHVVEDRLGIKKAERQITEALDNRIAASSDFKLDVVSYQRKQSRWLRIVFAGALSAFVALEFMELITEWFGLHYGQSVYDLIGCVAQLEGPRPAGCSSPSLASSLAESKNFRVSSILAVFGAIGAVVVGTVVALGRKLDDDE